MSSVDSSMNFPKFLYSGVVKKLHKRSHTRYQKRRLEFYPDRVDYYKIDSDRRSGTIPISGVRVELRPNEENHFEFVFDDIKARQYVFMCETDVVKASMLWIANGEQHNNYGPTLRQLRPATLEYMNNMKSHNIIRELILKKYKQAATFFSSGMGLAREYEDADSIGIERMTSKIPTDTSSSDDETESQSSSTTSSSRALHKRPQHLTLKSTQGAKSFDMMEKEGYMTACPVAPQNERQQKFLAQKGTPSLELSEEDPDYMSFPQLRGLKNQLDSAARLRKPDEPPNTFPHESQGRRQTMSNRPDVVYNITYNGNGDSVVEFGSREVNAVKARICGQIDFIEIDVADLGQTFEELKFTLCNEFDIDKEDIVCIRKLPDVRITNDKDVKRIRAGRKIEIEVRDT